MNEVDVVVIGAGQAGLSSAWFLRHYGVDFVVLDADAAPGGAWQHRAPSLRMDDVHGIFDLPGLPRPPIAAGPAFQVVPECFAWYERAAGLDVRRPTKVSTVTNGPDGRLHVSGWSARAVVNATGTWSQPYRPWYPGDFQGRQLHYADYRGPAEFAGQRVIVVGGGASAIQVLADLAGVATTIWATRRAPVFHDGPFDEARGRAVVAEVAARVADGLPPRSVVSVTGLGHSRLVDRASDAGVLVRHPMFDRLAPGGAWWGEDFEPADAIVWATGFRAALTHLAPLHLREPSGGIRMEGTRVARDSRVHLIGYGPSASTVGANRAGRAAARELARGRQVHGGAALVA